MARDRILQIYRGTTAQNDAFTGAQGELTMDTARKEIRIHDGSTAGGNVVGLTPGFIAPFAGSTAPAGWLVCDGSAVSRTTYAKLFAVIGTTYGEGDGNSTFNLPTFSYKQIENSIACKGDGKIMGCMDGNGYLFGLSGWDSNLAYLSRDTNLYGKTLPAGRTSVFKTSSGIGLTTDKAKSGIVADTSGLSGCNMCIKY